MSHLKRFVTFICVAFVTSLIFSQQVQLNDDLDENVPKTIEVGVYISPPFVLNTDEEFSGMAIDLWEHIAKNLKTNYTYKVYDNFHDLVVATNSDSVSVAVTNLTITKERAQKIDFTQPWFDAGLKIMVTENKATSSNALLNGLRDAGHLTSYFVLVVLVLLLTVLMTLFDRKFDKEFTKNWRDGLADSFYQVMLMFTSGKLSRKNLFGWVGRVFAAIWLAVGILVVAYVTSSITSVMTTLSLSNEINQLSDLNGKKVGVVKDSETEDFIHGRGFNYIPYLNIDAMVDGLEDGSVDAIVGDAPILEYYQFTHHNKSLEVVGSLFKPDKYGFGLSPKNTLKKEITLEILKAHESGYIRKLKSNYFGQSQ